MKSSRPPSTPTSTHQIGMSLSSKARSSCVCTWDRPEHVPSHPDACLSPKLHSCKTVTPSQATYLSQPPDPGRPRPHPSGTHRGPMGPVGLTSLTPFFHTHQSFPTGQAEGGYGVGEGGDIEPSVRLKHKLIQWPLDGVVGKAIHTRPAVQECSPKLPPGRLA